MFICLSYQKIRAILSMKDINNGHVKIEGDMRLRYDMHNHNKMIYHCAVNDTFRFLWFGSLGCGIMVIRVTNVLCV